MIIEIGAPSSLLLGLTKSTDGHINQLGITLQHPPILMAGQKHPHLQITGARANIAHHYAQRFIDYHHLDGGVEVDLELAIPAQVGLASDTMLGLSVAKAMAWCYDLPTDDSLQLAKAIGLPAHEIAAIHGFQQGGLIYAEITDAEAQQVGQLKQVSISHDPRKAWAFVLVFPPLPDTLTETHEADAIATLYQAHADLTTETGTVVTEHILPGIENNDLASFAQAIQQLHDHNQTILGAEKNRSTEAEATLAIMRDNGAVMCGQMLTGVGLFGLIEGAQASVDLRRKLRDHLGYFGGTVMATITDNRGAQAIEQNTTLKQYVPKNLI
ncbi:MAG: hypothetical protein AAF629_18145 [Chloroflexota bacterium]